MFPKTGEKFPISILSLLGGSDQPTNPTERYTDGYRS
jgi:hypothetical protein